MYNLYLKKLYGSYYKDLLPSIKEESDGFVTPENEFIFALIANIIINGSALVITKKDIPVIEQTGLKFKYEYDRFNKLIVKSELSKIELLLMASKLATNSELKEVMKALMAYTYIDINSDINSISKFDLSSMKHKSGSSATVFLDKENQLAIKQRHVFSCQQEYISFVLNKNRLNLCPVLWRCKSNKDGIITECFPLISEYSDTDSYLVSEGFDPFYSDLEDLVGVTGVRELYEYLRYPPSAYKKLINNGLIDDNVAKCLCDLLMKDLNFQVSDCDFEDVCNRIKSIANAQRYFNIDFMDLGKKSHYGVFENRLVFLDYGANQVINRLKFIGSNLSYSELAIFKEV